MNTGLLRLAVATVLTVYGIETEISFARHGQPLLVATVLTVYGIETLVFSELSLWNSRCNSAYRLRY